MIVATGMVTMTGIASHESTKDTKSRKWTRDSARGTLKPTTHDHFRDFVRNHPEVRVMVAVQGPSPDQH